MSITPVRSSARLSKTSSPRLLRTIQRSPSRRSSRANSVAHDGRFWASDMYSKTRSRGAGSTVVTVSLLIATSPPVGRYGTWRSPAPTAARERAGRGRPGPGVRRRAAHARARSAERAGPADPRGRSSERPAHRAPSAGPSWSSSAWPAARARRARPSAGRPPPTGGAGSIRTRGGPPGSRLPRTPGPAARSSAATPSRAGSPGWLGWVRLAGGGWESPEQKIVRYRTKCQEAAQRAEALAQRHVRHPAVAAAHLAQRAGDPADALVQLRRIDHRERQPQAGLERPLRDDGRARDVGDAVADG